MAHETQLEAVRLKFPRAWRELLSPSHSVLERSGKPLKSVGVEAARLGHHCAINASAWAIGRLSAFQDRLADFSAQHEEALRTDLASAAITPPLGEPRIVAKQSLSSRLRSSLPRRFISPQATSVAASDMTSMNKAVADASPLNELPLLDMEEGKLTRVAPHPRQNPMTKDELQ